MKWWLSIAQSLRCLFFFHKLKLQKHIKGDHDQETWVAALRCEHCGRRYIISEVHQAMLRYDNDPAFRQEITQIYPHVKATEL